MSDPVLWETPIVISFQASGHDCRAAQLGPSMWGLNMGVCTITFEQAPPVDTEKLEADRTRVIIGNTWFDTDDVAAHKVAALMRGERS